VWRLAYHGLVIFHRLTRCGTSSSTSAVPGTRLRLSAGPREPAGCLCLRRRPAVRRQGGPSSGRCSSSAVGPGASFDDSSTGPAGRPTAANCAVTGRRPGSRLDRKVGVEGKVPPLAALALGLLVTGVLPQLRPVELSGILLLTPAEAMLLAA